jgi:predicted transcriptional regulator
MNITLALPDAITERLKTVARLTGDPRTLDLVAEDYIEPALNGKAQLLVRNELNRTLQRLAGATDDALQGIALVANGTITPDMLSAAQTAAATPANPRAGANPAPAQTATPAQ